MTLNELKNDVASLGFESQVEDESCFIASANRALSLIYTDRPVSKTATLSFRHPRLSAAYELIEHVSDATVVIPISGKAISFRSSGTGTCIIKDRTGASEVPLLGNDQLTKQLVYGDATATFTGEFYYTIKNFAVFDDLVSKKVVDIPEYLPYRELFPDEYCDDFRAFAGVPRDKLGNPIEGAVLADGKIRVPYTFRGEMYLSYYRSPARITNDDPNKAIDISDECAPMLPLLTAAFTWLDDDAAKAQYYMNLYRDLMANLRRYSTNRIETSYGVNGWA